MEQEIKKIKEELLQLQFKLEKIESAQNNSFKGSLDDILIERVLNTNTSGTPNTNTILRDITIPVSINVPIPDPILLPTNVPVNFDVDLTVLDYPERFMIYTWKGQRLAIPVYDADKIIYP